jgi:hypothetical protein
LWRQGNLLHFGFDLTPEQMNGIGQELLLNSIVYITRFQEDRPIPLTPSGWGKTRGPYPRQPIDLASKKAKFDPKLYSHLFTPNTLAPATLADADAFRKWYGENRGFLYADKEARLVVDEEAKEWGVPSDRLEFFTRPLEALGKGGEGAVRARRLLARYVPEGPHGEGTQRAWQVWLRENRDYLFFSDLGGYRWYVDPLAKKRGIPTVRLRGMARGS